MPDRILVVSPVPAFGEGIATFLIDNGLDAVNPGDPMRWLRDHTPDAAIVIVGSPDGEMMIRTLSADHPKLAIVGLLPAPGAVDCRWILDAGAHAAIPWSASSAEILQALLSAMGGLTTLPTEAARAMARSVPGRSPAIGIEAHEEQWLRDLARGSSVVDLARRVGYSQRELYRRLAQLYRRMGVTTRPEAIALAAQWGLLHEP
jgi:DNA-binding NarL/FixJ family response regulator